MNFLANQPIKWYALLKYNSHTIQFIHLRYSMVFRIFMVVQPQTQSILHFSKFQKRNLVQIRDHSHSFQFPQVWSNNNLLLIVCILACSGLPNWLSGKESACIAEAAGDTGSIPGWGRSPREVKATHSSILAWRSPWWGQCPQGHKESDTTEVTQHSAAQHLPILDISYRQIHTICDLPRMISWNTLAISPILQHSFLSLFYYCIIYLLFTYTIVYSSSH